MRALTLSALAVALTVTPAMFAGVIPYANGGNLAQQSVLTASATGDVIGYFVQGGAASGGGTEALDSIALFDVTTGTLSAFFFDSQTALAGDTADFGPVTQGDTLVFELLNEGKHNNILATDGAYSIDGDNHGYETSFAGGTLNGVSIPAGTYVGMEDTPVFSNSDLSYNDEVFVVTNVSSSTSPVPEPSSLVLLGTGLWGGVGAVRRRMNRA